MPKYYVTDLGNGSSAACKEMTKPGGPTTCYDAAVYSLVVTGELKRAVWEAWRMEVPKANTILVVNPGVDPRVANPKALPGDALVGFYRRFRKGEGSAQIAEVTAKWVIYHMVRTVAAGSTLVVGANNGDRDGTKPPWSQNDVEKMFDWTGKEKPSMFEGDGLPLENTYGVNDKEQFVAFAAPIATVVTRLNRAFPGPAAFG